ncbi:MAG TPA: TIGR03943 family protein [Paenibacillus sp.]|nr:TIGR03943 family protein [Paenibacillus sp.]
MFVHRLLRAFLSAAFAFYIVYLVKNDALQYYIAPKMELYVKLSAIALMLFAVVQTVSAFAYLRARQPEACDCHHPPSPSLLKNAATYGVLLSPLLFGYLLPDLALGSDLVDKKGIVLSRSQPDSAAADSRAEPEPEPKAAADSNGMTEAQLRDSFLTGDLYEDQYAGMAASLMLQDPILVRDDAFLEIITAIDLFMHRFAGKTIQVEGFVYRPEGIAPNEFVVARMAMDCCSADATPYGFLVESANAPAFAEDTWVRVTGKIGTVEWDGFDIVKIEADSAEAIDSPDTPYVYPNYEAIDEAQIP